MQRKIAMIQPYFGSLPSYFELALKSYGYNADFDWFIFTDDRRHFDYPPNVTVTYTTLPQLKAEFQQHFDFPISLEKPYKICDYRPLYGHLFSSCLIGYDFWGHFDPDVIFGDLSKFVTEEITRQYDRLGLKGHFSLYRNTPAINQLYQEKLANCLYYKYVIGSERNWGFDELDTGVNAFFAARNLRIHPGYPIADIHYRDYAMKVLHGTGTEKEKSRKSCFAYERGSVNRYYWLEGGIHREEFLYIHLMKRNMKVLCRNPSAYLIYGNAFREWEPITGNLLASSNKDRFFYRFWDKLKFVYTHRIKPACTILFVERDYRKFAVKLAGRTRSMQQGPRKS